MEQFDVGPEPSFVIASNSPASSAELEYALISSGLNLSNTISNGNTEMCVIQFDGWQLILQAATIPVPAPPPKLFYTTFWRSITRRLYSKYLLSNGKSTRLSSRAKNSARGAKIEPDTD
jgi:hypothetical protein